MKNGDNKEVDLLLRALGRRAASLETPALGEHLDADELNAFAEGQLPETTRTRYVAHVADCDACRRIVVNLRQAAGPVTAASTAPTRRNVWSTITAFFSPTVFRYAIPALAIVAVVGISLIVLRQRENTDFVAQHQPDNSSAKVQNAPQTVVPQTTPSVGQSANTEAAQPEIAKEKNTGISDRFGQPTTSTPSSDLSPAPVDKTSDKLAELKPGQAPVFAPEPQAAPPPPPRVAQEDEDKTKALSKREAETDTARHRDEVRSQPTEQQEENRAAAAPMTERRVEGLMAERRGFGTKTKKDNADDTETMTVAGRQFRRHQNGWIDVAYSASRATTTVARGSEQFRALIADEPALGEIANRLSGEVIVVWKGRAYRIR